MVLHCKVIWLTGTQHIDVLALQRRLAVWHSKTQRGSVAHCSRFFDSEWRTEHVHKRVAGEVSTTPGAVIGVFFPCRYMQGFERYRARIDIHVKEGKEEPTCWSAQVLRPSTYSSFVPITTAAVRRPYAAVAYRSPPSISSIISGRPDGVAGHVRACYRSIA